MRRYTASPGAKRGRGSRAEEAVLDFSLRRRRVRRAPRQGASPSANAVPWLVRLCPGVIRGDDGSQDGVVAMRQRTVAIIAVLFFVGGGLAVKRAGAQAAPSMLCCDAASGACVSMNAAQCPNPTGDAELAFSGSTAAPVTVTVQTTEPASGFTGACLLPFMAYQPTLPSVCYSPGGTVKYGAGSTRVTIPAAKVFRSYSTLPPQYDSFQPLATCYPHSADGTCPSISQAVSRSCCDYGTNMTSSDGVFAAGGRASPPSLDGYFAHGTANFSLQ